MAGLKYPKLGLALGGGGARGLVHIGVIKVLEEYGIPIEYIAGTSIGALVGGFYAAGMSVVEIEEIALQTDWRRVFSVLFEPHLRQGLIGGRKVEAFINGYLNDKSFHQCRIPFAAVATDLRTGEAVIMNTGIMTQAIRASISIPLVFKPMDIEGKMLADGGLSAPVPVEIVRSMGADVVLAVNLDKLFASTRRKPGWYDIANSSLSILRHHLADFNAANADVVIDVNVGKGSWYGFVHGEDKIKAGENKTRLIMPQLMHLLRR